MPPAAARAVTRGRFRVTQEDAAASPAPRDGADDQRVLRGLQHQSTMVLQRLAELEKAVRSQHRGGDEQRPRPGASVVAATAAAQRGTADRNRVERIMMAQHQEKVNAGTRLGSVQEDTDTSSALAAFLERKAPKSCDRDQFALAINGLFDEDQIGTEVRSSLRALYFLLYAYTLYRSTRRCGPRCVRAS